MSGNYDGDFIRLGSRLKVGETGRIGSFGDKSQGRLPVRDTVAHLSFAFKRRFQVLRDYFYGYDTSDWIAFFIGLGLGGAGFGFIGYKLGKWGERKAGATAIFKKIFK